MGYSLYYLISVFRLLKGTVKLKHIDVRGWRLSHLTSMNTLTHLQTLNMRNVNIDIPAETIDPISTVSLLLWKCFILTETITLIISNIIICVVIF